VQRRCVAPQPGEHGVGRGIAVATRAGYNMFTARGRTAIEVPLSRNAIVAVCLVLLGACASDTSAHDMAPDSQAGHPTSDHPAYVEDIAPILQRRCTGCHGSPTAVTETRNCLRADRWDSADDPDHRCSDPRMAGKIFGVRDAGPIILENVISRRMPLGGPALSDDELALFQRWANSGYPKRAVDQPPTIELTMPSTGDVALCQDSCRYTLGYATHDPEGDSITWSLGWTGAGQIGVFVSGLAGGSGSVTIDAAPLAAGTYTLSATLDDGTVRVTSAAPRPLTVLASHNAAPIVSVVMPNGGEGYDSGQPIAISWVGSDPDDAALAYEVSAVGATTTPIATLTAPVGPAQVTWTAPQVTVPTSFRIVVTARDATARPALSTDRSDADFVVRPPAAAVSFAQQIQPLLTASCAGSQCHGGSPPASELRLTAGSAYSALVNVAVNESPCASYRRVAPGQPDQSYLIFKLQGSGACFTGSRMPRGMPALSAPELQLFRDWIANGAPNN
jgi:hypothetical protein